MGRQRSGDADHVEEDPNNWPADGTATEVEARSEVVAQQAERALSDTCANGRGAQGVYTAPSGSLGVLLEVAWGRELSSLFPLINYNLRLLLSYPQTHQLHLILSKSMTLVIVSTDITR
jgi:hypothetical protein